MKNLMQLKDLINNLAKEKKINSQVLLRNYMMQRLLYKIAKSRYNNNFILKGGMLVSSLVGIGERSTVDLDATVKSIELNKDKLVEIFNEIFSSATADEIKFEINRIEEIRAEDQYKGFRIALTALMENARIPLKLDLTTGDQITPGEIRYNYKLLFEDQKIEISSYNIETLLAEKLETIISRSTANTRMRDFYDVYILFLNYKKEIDFKILKLALLETSKYRESYKNIVNGEQILKDIFESDFLLDHWRRYSRKYNYARNIDFEDLGEKLMNLWNLIKDIRMS
jgi:predicted nucleotidyltransferase component of viral defense system